MGKNKLVICIDFDGTCTTHEFPKIGKEIGAVPVIKRLVAEGHKIIVFTMRSNIGEVGGNTLDQAVKWFKDNGIPLYGINSNPTQKHWTISPKAYGHLYIDDAALGVPLKYDEEMSDRPFVDWKLVEILLELQNILTKKEENV